MSGQKSMGRGRSVGTSDAGKATEQVAENTFRSPGLRDVKTTGVFRVVNFELFVKPNKLVMGVGFLVLSGCVAYLAYLNTTKENQKQYTAMNDDGSFSKRKRTSRWD